MKVDARLYECTVITKKEVPGVKEPSQMYYRLGVWKDQEVGELRCTKDIYDGVKALHTYDLGLMFNTDYNSLQVDQVLNHYPSSPFLEALMAQQAAAMAAAPAPEPSVAAPAPDQKEAAEAKEEPVTTTKPSKK